jgi:hypothetical protein
MLGLEAARADEAERHRIHQADCPSVRAPALAAPLASRRTEDHSPLPRLLPLTPRLESGWFGNRLICRQFESGP